MKRSRLSKHEREALLKAQGGCCCVWGCTETRDLIEEHSTPFVWTGARANQLMCRRCHSEKTSLDIGKIAKVKRIANKRTQYDKRAENGPQIKSRGFQGWRGFDGSIKKRGA